MAVEDEMINGKEEIKSNKCCCTFKLWRGICGDVNLSTSYREERKPKY